MASYSGLWNNEYNEPYSALGTNNTRDVNNSLRTQLAKLLGRKRGSRKLAELMITLTGATAGSTASVNHVDIKNESTVGTSMGNGGKRTIRTTADLNRATTSADATLITDALQQVFAPNPYPVDKSGNGGANKRNRF